ncbi:MAG: recombinase family protein [Polyangiales bacterium]
MARPKRGSPTIAVGYVRASTERQELGPEAQRAELARWAERHAITLASIHEDALSGGTEIDDRPGLLAALDAVREHRAGVLVVTRRDRLARDVVIAATIERAAQRAGARVVSADGVGTGDSPAESFQRSILDAVAQFERALIRERTRAALRAKRARGQRAGNVPWGYRARADGVLEEHEHERTIAARVHALRSDGMSLRVIVRALATDGITGRSGRALTLTQIARIARGART